ncbi:hypothetical protein MRX96_035995 [Rhipicephalus microplus]
MAAPAQSLLNCEQKTADSAELPPPGSGGGLKNGASGEELSADEIPAGVMVNNRVKSPSNASGHIGRELTMDNFQDGGTHQLNARPSAVAGDPAAFADRQRLGSDFRAYNPNLRDSVMGGEEFRNSPDGMNHVPVPGYGTGARGPRWGPWGGPQRPGSMMPCYPPSANGGGAPPQRFLSGPSLSQQGGPTPTLNQLLQSPNPLHRYQNSYGEYNSMHKGMADVGQQYSPWARGSYPQQIAAPMYRPPLGGTMHDPGGGGGGGGAVPASAGAAPASGAASAGGPAAKRPYMGPAQYTQYQQRQPYPGQPRPPSQGYPQQQMSPYPTGPQPPPGQVGGPHPPSPAPSPHQQERPTPPPQAQGSASPSRGGGPDGPPSRQGTPNSHPSAYGGYPPSSSSSAVGPPLPPTSASSSSLSSSASVAPTSSSSSSSSSMSSSGSVPVMVIFQYGRSLCGLSEVQAVDAPANLGRRDNHVLPLLRGESAFWLRSKHLSLVLVSPCEGAAAFGSEGKIARVSSARTKTCEAADSSHVWARFAFRRRRRLSTITRK